MPRDRSKDYVLMRQDTQEVISLSFARSARSLRRAASQCDCGMSRPDVSNDDPRMIEQHGLVYVCLVCARTWVQPA